MSKITPPYGFELGVRPQLKNGLQHLALNRGVQRKSRLWSAAGQKVLRELPLEGWAQWLAGRFHQGCAIYAYFNNDAGGHAPRNAAQLRDKILRYVDR